MKKSLCVAVLSGLVLGTGALSGALAGDAPGSMAEWRFPVGLSYISGFSDVVDYYDRTTGGDSSGYIPIGLSFTPYYQFDHGSRLGLDVGPAGAIIGDTSFWDVPFGVSYGFTFIPHASASPYARFGLKYHVAGGDNVDSSSPGGFGAVGVELLRKKMVGIQVEIGYDASEVTFKLEEIGSHHPSASTHEETIKPGALTISLRAVF